MPIVSFPHLLPSPVTPAQGHLLSHSHPHTPPETVGGMSRGVGGAQDSRRRFLCRHCTQCMFISLSVRLSVCLSVRPSVSQSVCCLSVVRLSVTQSVCLFVLSVALSVHMAVFIHLSICLPLCPSVLFFIHTLHLLLVQSACSSTHPLICLSFSSSQTHFSTSFTM